MTAESQKTIYAQCENDDILMNVSLLDVASGIEVNSMVTIRTKRLTLRDFDETDWQQVHSYASDPEVVRYMDWGPNTEEETEAFVRRSIHGQKEHPRTDYALAITLTAKAKLIGGCGLYVTDTDNREGRIGYCLNSSLWGQGFGTEVAKALLRFGFQRLGLHRIFATCTPENIRSRRVLEKIGMRCEGHFREHKWAKGRWRDSLLYAMLENERKEPKA